MAAPAKTIHADQYLVTGLLQNNTIVVRDIYERFAGKVQAYILHNNGSEDDAADIFQEALIDVYQQARYKEFRLTCPFEPFFLLVCKRKWINELKKRGKQRVTKEPDDLSMGENVFELADQLRVQDERVSLFIEMFQKLGDRCREIIQKCLSDQPQDKVAMELGVSYAYLRKKKSECMADLIKMIRSKKTLENE
jgi:RNA polymerase sigma factor (sigma-70 family)